MKNKIGDRVYVDFKSSNNMETDGTHVLVRARLIVWIKILIL